MSSRARNGRALCAGLAVLAALVALPGRAQAQPFGAWLTLSGRPVHGYIEIPHSPALNPTGAFTFEAWVAISDPGGACSSIAGKQWTQAWWVGICGDTLRSYLKGTASQRNGGVIPPGQWTHIAIVFNGTRRFHYVNGEKVGDFPETGPLATSTQPVRIGSDVAWQFTPSGAIDEVRLWNVARSQAQIRASMSGLTGSTAGLVALWTLNGNAQDVAGPHDGAVMGAGTGFLTFPVALSCGANTATSLCLQDRFLVTARFRTGPPGTAEGTAQTVGCANDGSGLFWFFHADNWEVMVKAINGCGLNDRFWVFSAATTNVFYRLEVLDVRAGAQRIYFNYSGPPAPAVTDTGAFATCP